MSDQTRGFSPGLSPTSMKTKLTIKHKKAMSSFVDLRHIECKAVVTCYMLTLLLDKFDLVVHMTTIGRTMNTLELRWLPMCQEKQTFAFYMIKAIRDDQIAFDSHIIHQSTRQSNTVYVMALNGKVTLAIPRQGTMVRSPVRLCG